MKLNNNDLEYLQRALTLLQECPPTVRQVIDAGDKAINAAGMNPYCLNEGRVTGDKPVYLWWVPDLQKKLSSQL